MITHKLYAEPLYIVFFFISHDDANG